MLPLCLHKTGCKKSPTKRNMTFTDGRLAGMKPSERQIIVWRIFVIRSLASALSGEADSCKRWCWLREKKEGEETIALILNGRSTKALLR